MTHLAVLSPEPLANKSVLGFQAHINTSLSCPLKTVALLAGISMDWSTSIFSGAVGVAALAALQVEFYKIYENNISITIL